MMHAIIGLDLLLTIGPHALKPNTNTSSIWQMLWEILQTSAIRYLYATSYVSAISVLIRTV